MAITGSFDWPTAVSHATETQVSIYFQLQMYGTFA